jgi:NitT/TauT family transport system ATP-binding protein
MTPRPGRIHRLLDIDLPRPRAADIRNTPAFVALRQQAWVALRGVPESTAATPARRQEVRA